MRWVLRGALIALTFSLAFVAFRAGVGVSAREGLPGADLLTHTYYALGLFVLGGLDLGLPQGGSTVMRGVLWLAYFSAPLITTGAVIEGALYVFRPEWWVRRGLRDHIVIVGGGRLGMLFLEALREREPHALVVVVDREGARAEDLRNRLGARFLIGDARTHATFDALRLERARAVALLTDDDLANLEAAWHIAARAPSASVIAHVADIGMRRTVAPLEHVNRVHIFNAHYIAARQLHEEHLARYFENTVAEDVVVLAGFGRFGQTILEYLQREAKGEVQRAIVVDIEAARQARLFRAQVAGFEHCDLVAVEGDLDDPHTWSEVERATAQIDVAPVFVVGTDSDQVNLRTAIALRGQRPDARIFVRCVYESTFSTELSQKLSFEVLAVEHMLRRALRDQQTEWLRNT